MFGQSNSLPKNIKTISIPQMDLVSAELVSIVSMMLEKPDLFESENESTFATKNNTIGLKLQPFNDRLNIILKSEANKSDWNKISFPTVAHKNFLSATSVQQFEKLHAINSTQNLRQNIYEPFATNISLQNFIGENVKSFMHPSATFRWVELENNKWLPNGIAPTPTNKVQVRNWKGQLGVGVGSYY
jgi:hypothetical protein